MSVDEAVELGIFIVKRCKEHVVDCDGPTSVVTWRLGQSAWMPLPPASVLETETKFNKKKLRDNLLSFWFAETPHISRPLGISHDAREGGLVKLRHAVGLKSTLSQKAKETARKRKQ